MLTPDTARQLGKRARRRLSPTQRRRASETICRRISRSPWFRGARIVVAYVATSEEVDLMSLAQYAARTGKQVWLPVVTDDGVLALRRWRPSQPLRSNRYGILEPFDPDRSDTSVQWRERTVVCAPVVAFDAKLNRVGMGGGYYDRLFARTEHLACVSRLGVAFECQHTDAIGAAPWDAPLDLVVTEAMVRRRAGPRRMP